MPNLESETYLTSLGLAGGAVVAVLVPASYGIAIRLFALPAIVAVALFVYSRQLYVAGTNSAAHKQPDEWRAISARESCMLKRPSGISISSQGDFRA